MYPSYLNLYNNGLLQKRAEQVYGLLASCQLCPRKCGINRLNNEKGFCKTGLKPKVYSYLAHFGEEPPISGTAGSGTIFFSNCNMACVYCQNYEFSQKEEGRELDYEELADVMIKLQNLGCHNINLVSPTHNMAQILKALALAAARGLHLPLVYNTGGYDLPEMINFWDGIADIYLPDMRYADEATARAYSAASDYPYYNRLSVSQMHKQVGIAKMDEAGIIQRGLIIRHLVLPGGLSGTEKIMEFIAKEVSGDTYISLMSQYYPYYLARERPPLDRRLKFQEYAQAKQIMANSGLHNGWIQESLGLERFAGVNIKPNY